ncbi:MAG: hypothetical protein WCS54_08225, partial [Fibrobacteraceae bacterium]
GILPREKQSWNDKQYSKALNISHTAQYSKNPAHAHGVFTRNCIKINELHAQNATRKPRVRGTRTFRQART